MRIVQVFKQGGRLVRRVYKKKPERPKGVKSSSYNQTAAGLDRKKASARKVAIRLHKEGKAGSGHFKYHEYPESGRQKCREATRSLIAQGILNPAKNIRKFIAAGGSKKYWNSRVNHGTHGLFYSKKNKKHIRYDSSWELDRMAYFEKDTSVVSYRKNPVQIPYSLNGQTHYYFPDFMVQYKDGTRVLEEIKPREFLKDSKVRQKIKVATLFCKNLRIQFRIVSQKEKLTL